MQSIRRLSTTRQVYNLQQSINISHSIPPLPSEILEPPNFKKYHENISKIAVNLTNLSAYPTDSQYLNPQHYYQNTVLLDWCGRNTHPVTLKQLAAYGKALNEEKVISSANFVKLELPIRISIKLKEMQELPFNVVNNYHLSKVYESYYDIFERFRKIPKINTIEDNEKFCKDLRILLTDVNLLNLPNLMMGALETCILDGLPQKQLDELVSKLLRARISRRLIVEEHLALTKNFMENPNQPRSSNHIGDIFMRCSAVEHLNICSNNASKFIESIYPDIKIPKLIIEGNDVKFQFLTSHLHYLFGEILRNSYEATVKNFVENQHSKNKEVQPQPVKVTIIDNKDYVLFRFSDRGGGISMKPITKIWSFGKDPELAKQSLSNFHQLPYLNDFNSNEPNSEDYENTEALKKTSLGAIDKSGLETTLYNLIQRPANYKLGLGMAMCKVYADYWNGDITMHSLDGFGTDTFLKIGKLGRANDKPQLDRV